jgi:hypothetical protein
MHNNDLTQAIRQLEQEINRETLELQKKEDELRTQEAAVIDLRNKLRDHVNTIPRLKQDIVKIKREQVQKHDELQRVQTSYQDALRKSNIKLR